MPDLGEIDPLKFIEISFEQTELYNVLTTDTLASPHIFAKWEIERGGASPSQRLSLFYMQVNALMERLTGIGSIKWGFYTSPDGTTWSSFLTNEFSSTPEGQAQQDIAANVVTDTTNFIAALIQNTNGSTSGTIRRFGFNGLFYLPLGYTLTRLI